MQNDNKDLDIRFLGLAQNCEKFLPNFFNKIDKISKSLKIQVFIGENGSNDFTFHIIHKKIAAKKIYNFVDTTGIEIHEDRIKRLATARQLLKDKIIKLNLKSEFVCVIDLDDVINDVFNLDLLKSFMINLKKNQNKYFGISLNSKPFYYDILNFESDEFPNRDIKQLQNNKSIRSYKFRKFLIYDVQKALSKKFEFECVSGFNGLCLYNFNEYITSNYLQNDPDQIPEHLLFNRYLNKTVKKKILVTNNYFRMPNEHKPLNNIFEFLFMKFLKYFNIYFKRIFD